MDTKSVPSLSREELRGGVGNIVHVVGQPIGYRIEANQNADRIDHLSISVRAGNADVIEIALNTFSLRNARRGRDPRIRLAIVVSTWGALPAAGIFPSDGLLYAAVEAENKVAYHEYERSALEALLIRKIDTALLVEGWGELYLRSHPGIHQVHYRRKTSALPEGEHSRDGAVRFYFEEKGTTELLLLKFFGQD
ncbi:MAG: hypothetical protein M3R29_01690 [Verrucomicrobiota bacterium]|nr:hypothetical protein [Verrucomicrobiota bacterium]